MLIPILLLATSLLPPVVSVPQPASQAMDAAVAVNATQDDLHTAGLQAANAWHVPGTPPPAPRRDEDTPPVIKDKPLPPV